MKGYRIFKYQAEVLMQQTMSDGTRYNPVQDKNDNYFIFEKEYRQCNIENAVYTEFIPPPQEPIE